MTFSSSDVNRCVIEACVSNHRTKVRTFYRLDIIILHFGVIFLVALKTASDHLRNLTRKNILTDIKTCIWLEKYCLFNSEVQ